MVITQVILHPQIEWEEGISCSLEDLRRLYDKAHQECVLANSVTCEIHTEIL